MRNGLLRLILSKKEITIIHDALDDMRVKCKNTLNESCQDTVEDIRNLKIKLPKPATYLYDL